VAVPVLTHPAVVQFALAAKFSVKVVCPHEVITKAKNNITTIPARLITEVRLKKLFFPLLNTKIEERGEDKVCGIIS
jgi:hypothetical protein